MTVTELVENKTREISDPDLFLKSAFVADINYRCQIGVHRW